MNLEERRRGDATETVEACEDFVEDDWEAGPRCGSLSRVTGCCICGEEMWVGTNDVDEGLLEKGVAVVLVSMCFLGRGDRNLP